MEKKSLEDVTPTPTVGGVFPIRNGIEVCYPFVEAIVSTIPFVDELVIIDGGSTDGTLDILHELGNIYSTITLYEREELKPTARHEIIDEQLLFGIDQLDTDWIFELQADEIWPPRFIHPMCQVITAADAKGANSIRQWRTRNNSSVTLATVRFVRNLDDLGSWSGGDSFYRLSESRSPYIDYTKHNVQPEYQTELYFTHLDCEDREGHMKRHAIWLSRDNDSRRKAWEKTIKEKHSETGNNFDHFSNEGGGVRIKHPGTSEDVADELFGETVRHIDSETKESCNLDLERMCVDDVSDPIVVDNNGNEYRHSFHQAYDGGLLEIRNNPETSVDLRVNLSEPYDVESTPTYDINSVFFDPSQMEEYTGLPYMNIIK